MSTIDIQFDRKIDNSRIVRETDGRCRREYICLTLLGAVFVLGTLFYAWQQYQWIQYGYRIEEAQKEIEALAETGRQLRVERATLANPQRIDAIARTELGMTGPSAGQVVTLEADVFGPRDPEAQQTLLARRDGGD
jgi:cell division protein FtsL